MGNEKERDTWGGQVDFILSCLGYAVGLGNVWRFPYLCGENGGGAFLIPWLIMMIFAGFPVFYLELAIGQFAAKTPHLLYRSMCPLFTGIGLTMVIISVFTGFYYNMILAWALRYLYSAVTFDLPWKGCDHPWNTPLCKDWQGAETCEKTPEKPYHFMGACRSAEYFPHVVVDPATGNKTEYDLQFVTEFTSKNQTNFTVETAPEQFNQYVLGKFEEELGTPKWDLVLALFIAWVLIFFCLIRGVKSAGKVVWFTATFPYLLLVILLVRSLFLGEGVADGIEFYLTPKWEYLIKSSTWSTAANQIFFSLSLGGGGLSTLASYNKFDNNLFRDTLIVVIGNCGTSFFAGFVIFPIIGFVASRTDRLVEKVAAGGSTLAFTVYPEALNAMPWPTLWAILFFFMLLLLGIDSQLVIVDVVVTAVCDQFPVLRRPLYKATVVASVCFVSFLFGILLTTPAGPYIIELVDKYAAGWTLVLACCIEVCMVSYVYGLKRFVGDIKLMLGKPPNAFYRALGYPVNIYWIACWMVITPILLVAILIFSLASLERTSSDEYLYPVWADVVGWLITLFCISPIVLIGLYRYIKAQWPLCGQLYGHLVRPDDDWKPAVHTASDEYKSRALSSSKWSANNSPTPAAGGPQVNAAYSSGLPPPVGYNSGTHSVALDANRIRPSSEEVGGAARYEQKY